MIKIGWVGALAVGLLLTTNATAQHKKTRDDVDSRSFYKTPYRSRNSGSFDVDVRQISLGFGFPNTLDDNFYHYNSARSGRSGFGPILLKYEQALADEIGIGAMTEFAYRRWRYNVGNERYTEKVIGVGITLLGYYHFNKFIPISKLDVYAGVGININHTAYTDYYDETTRDIEVLPAGVAGARYLFTDQFGAYGEIGRTNYSWVNLGITFRL